MSGLLDRVSERLGGLHSGLREAMFGGRNEGGPLNGLFDGPDGNGPPGNGPGLDSLPPGQQNGGADSIPYGIAKQLDLPSLPVHGPGGPLPGTGNNPPSPNFPIPPANGGHTPAAPTPPPTAGQPPVTSGPGLPVQAPPTGMLPTPGGQAPPVVTQVVQTVQAVLGQPPPGAAATAAPIGRAETPVAVPASAAPAPANSATANPVPPSAAPAQTALATPPQPGPPGQSATAPPAAANPNVANPNVANPTTTAAAVPQARAETVPQPPPGRPDAVPAQQRPEGSLLDRLTSLLRPGAMTMAQGSQAAQSAAAATQAAAGTTVAAMPLAVQAAHAPMDARGNPLLAINDRVATQRADAVLAGIYTAEGPYRRALRRGSNVLSARFSSLLMALGLAGPPVTMRGRDADYQLSVALQWLFWLLAIVAYACLGLAMIAFLPAGSDVFGSGRSWTGGFAIAGLVAAAGAWWFARQLSRRGVSSDEAAPEPGPDDD